MSQKRRSSPRAWPWRARTARAPTIVSAADSCSRSATSRDGWSPSAAAGSATSSPSTSTHPRRPFTRRATCFTRPTWRARRSSPRTARCWSRATSTASWPISTASRARWPPSAPPSRRPSLPCSGATATRSSRSSTPTRRAMAWAVNRSGAFEGAGTLRVKVALLPAGHDPDTFLRSVGREGFMERIAAARSILSYALDRALVDPDGASGPRSRTTAFARVALLLAKVADGDEAAALSREAATKLGVDPTQLWIEAQRLQSSLRTPPTQAPPSAPVSTPPVERDLVTPLLLSDEARAALLGLLGEPDELGD